MLGLFVEGYANPHLELPIQRIENALARVTNATHGGDPE